MNIRTDNIPYIMFSDSTFVFDIPYFDFDTTKVQAWLCQKQNEQSKSNLKPLSNQFLRSVQSPQHLRPTHEHQSEWTEK